MPDNVITQTATPEPAAATTAQNATPADAGTAATATTGTAPIATSTAPQPAEQPKAAEPVEIAPEQYQDFDLGDGKKAIPASELSDFAAKAKEYNLTQEKANALLKTMLPAFRGKLNNSLTSAVEGWKKAAVSDPEYGGDSFKMNMQKANAAYAKYATPELQALMKRTGLSVHPDMIRMFYRIGTQLSQDTGITGQGSPQPKRRLFPNSNMAI